MKTHAFELLFNAFLYLIILMLNIPSVYGQQLKYFCYLDSFEVKVKNANTLNKIRFPLISSINNNVYASLKEVSYIEVEIATGRDDLRGGNDNAYIDIWTNNTNLGKAIDFGGKHPPIIKDEPLNNGMHWKNYSWNSKRIVLPKGITFDALLGIDIKTNFKGGISGDNWNIDRIKIVAVITDGSRKELYNKSGSPLIRFTGKNRLYQVRW
ncbi:MAG: hypothetical protein CMO01_24265 [Thalassobius sp.]|nr:hypothetical protein [Thalassovita sp.]|tara:strand:- start:97 stop:726 length:630 start_codon:yes stop_codon:yes gene_type:complete